jgi:hypothetical protein
MWLVNRWHKHPVLCPNVTYGEAVTKWSRHKWEGVMGLLSSGGTPRQGNNIMAVPKTKKAAKVPEGAPAQQHPCDQCGHSRIDGGHLAAAKVEVVTKDGSIFLCRHHYWLNWFHIHERAYEVREHDTAEATTS